MSHERETWSTPIELVHGGDAPGVVLFHGVTGTPRELDHLAGLLFEAGFNVYAPCLSGHASTVEELRRTRIAAWDRDIEAAVGRLPSGEQTLIGLSFGAILALRAAIACRSASSSLVLLSPPFRFQSRIREITLRLSSHLPDAVLDRMGAVEKPQRAPHTFVVERAAYTQHSKAAGARLVKMREEALRGAADLSLPVLLVQDRLDHHLSSSGVEVFRRAAPRCMLEVAWFEGAQHELTIGHERDAVADTVVRFLTRSRSNRVSEHAR